MQFGVCQVILTMMKIESKFVFLEQFLCCWFYLKIGTCFILSNFDLKMIFRQSLDYTLPSDSVRKRSFNAELNVVSQVKSNRYRLKKTIAARNLDNDESGSIV